MRRRTKIDRPFRIPLAPGSAGGSGEWRIRVIPKQRRQEPPAKPGANGREQFRRGAAMPDIDFFEFYRYMLAWIVGIYATIVTFQSLYGYYIWLAGSDRYMSLLRRYVIVQGLRLRFKTFWGDVVICLLLCVVFALLFRAHMALRDIERIRNDAGQLAQVVRH
jgi:hypothetical protein